MRKLSSWLLALALIVFLIPLKASLQEKSDDEKVFKYVGVKSCKPCHLTKKSGAQFKIWQDSPHAKAYETLQTDKAKAIAKKKGIEDPASSDKCLKCHVTAFGVDEKRKTSRLTMEEGVSCEACHGPGSEYKSKKIIEAIYKGELDGAEYGLIEPTAEVCTQCHNEESPTFKGFDYEKMAAKIAHPVPKEE